MLIHLRTYILVILAIAMEGCATITPQKPLNPISWENRQLTLQALQQWQLSGKIAVKTTQDSGSATVNWAQNQKDFAISLLGPLGTSSMKLTGQPRLVTLITAEGKQFTAPTPEQLLFAQWGFNVPISNLHYWIRGLPVPGLPYEGQFDIYHRLTDLTQQGWHIQFQNYTRVSTLDLPQKISITSSLLTVKIVVYQWKIHISH